MVRSGNEQKNSAGRERGSIVARSAAASPDELFEAASEILLSGCHGASKPAPEPWDFEIDNDFRGPYAFLNAAAARRFVERIARNYREAKAREDSAERLTEALDKFSEIEKRADELRRSVSNLTIDEYRLVHIGAEMENEPTAAAMYKNYIDLRDLLFPLDWQNAFSKKRTSGLSDHAAKISSYFSQVSSALSKKYGFTLSHPNPGGKTKSVHLLVPSARWRLVHISWQTFAALPHLHPSGSNNSDFHDFLKLIHQFVTGRAGNFSRELTGDHGHYARRRRSFDELVVLLRQKGAMLGWRNFQEMEDVLVSRSRRSTQPLEPELREKLLVQLKSYIDQRAALLLGPRASADSEYGLEQKK